MIATARDAIAFLLLGTLIPTIFLSVTGTPTPLVAWVFCWIVLTLTETRK